MVRMSAAAILLLALSLTAWASDVVLVSSAGSDAALKGKISAAAAFYGLAVQEVSLSTSTDSVKALQALKESDVIAVVLSAGVLGGLDREATLNALQRSDGRSIPLLIAISTPGKLSSALSKWSDGRVSACLDTQAAEREWLLEFSQDTEVVHELAGVALTGQGQSACGLAVSQDASVHVLIEQRKLTASYPVLVALPVNQHLISIAATSQALNEAQPDHPANLQRVFSDIAEFMVFLRNAAGQRAWHKPGNYANLTIDDPWLTEPYGNLSYKGLLSEMEVHNFHTTIAFVPWNYDRSARDVVSLLRDHPDRFSLSIHGNNHNHREFSEYSSEPFSRQSKSIEQALARMDKFSALTGLPYDRVMVFPHAIAPAETLALLKRSNYLATINSEDVPLGSRTPDEPLFALTPWTLAFNGFPSIKRVSAEVPVSAVNLAINAFLGNPQLFYVHQEVFQDNIGAFDPIADGINRLQPAVQWRGLGYIARHLYVLRLRPDNDFDVRATSANLVLDNPTDRRVVFHVLRPEDGAVPLRSVKVDGHPVPYQVLREELRFDVALEPRQSREAVISFGNELNLASVDISKSSLLVAFDRRLSDFRDLYLSRSILGRRIQAIYYGYGLDRAERSIERSVIAILVLIVSCLLLRVLIVRRRRISEQRKSPPHVGAI